MGRKMQDMLVRGFVMLQKVAEHLQQRPELLPTLLTTLFEIVLFEDCPNQWSLSRPMLSLILINEQVGPCCRPPRDPSPICVHVRMRA